MVSDSVLSAWTYKGSDPCARFFSHCIEGFAPPIPETARVLEIGCSEFPWLWHAKACWPLMSFYGIDTRKTEPVDGVTIIRDDALTFNFQAESFDWVVMVSTLEHVGLGYYKDPKDADGDSKLMRRVYDWLKPGGWLFFDVPWAGDVYHVRPKNRTYTDDAVRERLGQDLPWVKHWRTVRPLSNTRAMQIVGVWWQKPSP